MPSRGNPNWKKGVSQNPKGKQPGTKNKLPRELAERALTILDELEASGRGLRDYAEKERDKFLENFIKPLLPKNVEVNANMRMKLMADDELNEQITTLVGECIKASSK